MFYVTVTINGQHTGRLVAEAKTAEKAATEVARCREVGNYVRAGEELIVVELSNRGALRQLKAVDSPPVATEDMMRVAILGPNAVMNRDL